MRNFNFLAEQAVLGVSWSQTPKTGNKVIKIECSLKLKIKCNDWPCVRNQPIIALYFEFENELNFHNFGAWFSCAETQL